MITKIKYNNITIKSNPLQKKINIFRFILPFSLVIFILLVLFNFDNNYLINLILNSTMLNVSFFNNISINIDDTTLSVSKEAIVTFLGIIVEIIIAIIAVDRKRNNKQFNYLIVLFFSVIFIYLFICFFDKDETTGDTSSYSDTVFSIVENSIPEQTVTPETIVTIPTHIEKEYVTSQSNDYEHLKSTLTNEYISPSLNNTQKNKNDIKNVLSDLLNFKFTTKPTTTKAITTYFGTTEATTTTSNVISDYYNENGYLINGTFGCNEYNHYYKFNNETNDYYAYYKDELPNYNLLSAKLYFVDESNNTLINCALWATVPQAIKSNTSYYVTLRDNYNYNKKDIFYFQEGLYSFDLITNDGRVYSSEFVYINTNSTYIISTKYSGQIS